MEISRINSINFSGIKLANPNEQHAKYVMDVLKHHKINVIEHQPFNTKNDFSSKKNIANFVRKSDNFADNECGMIFFNSPKESWIIAKQYIEQNIKKLLDNHYIDSEINLGI